jgi:hypothetical protein
MSDTSTAKPSSPIPPPDDISTTTKDERITVNIPATIHQSPAFSAYTRSLVHNMNAEVTIIETGNNGQRVLTIFLQSNASSWRKIHLEKSARFR